MSTSASVTAEHTIIPATSSHTATLSGAEQTMIGTAGLLHSLLLDPDFSPALCVKWESLMESRIEELQHAALAVIAMQKAEAQHA